MFILLYTLNVYEILGLIQPRSYINLFILLIFNGILMSYIIMFSTVFTGHTIGTESAFYII